MPEQVPQSELDAVRQAVSRFAEGASIDAISGVLEFPVSRRTLQRRLAVLVERGELQLESSRRGSRYRLPQVSELSAVQEPADSTQISGEVSLPISREGRKIKQAVRSSLSWYSNW